MRRSENPSCEICIGYATHKVSNPGITRIANVLLCAHHLQLLMDIATENGVHPNTLLRRAS